MSADVVCMSLANVPPGEQRSRFLAVGLVDNTVRIISLDPSVSNNMLFLHLSADLGIRQGLQSLCPLNACFNGPLCQVCNVFVPQDCLQPLSMQALPAQPESLCIVEMGGVEKQDELGEKGTIGFLYLNIGLQVRNFLANDCKFGFRSTSIQQLLNKSTKPFFYNLIFVKCGSDVNRHQNIACCDFPLLRLTTR